MPKMLNQSNVKLTWVTSLTDFHAPTATELNAGVDLQCLIASSNFKFGVASEDSTTDPALCSVGNAATPGRVTYEAEADFFRYTTDPEDVGWTTFTEQGLNGYLVQRVGTAHDTNYAATDEVFVMQVISGTPQPLTPDNGAGYTKFHEKFYPQDNVDQRAVVA